MSVNEYSETISMNWNGDFIEINLDNTQTYSTHLE